jgi:hypothetical protein
VRLHHDGCCWVLTQQQARQQEQRQGQQLWLQQVLRHLLELLLQQHRLH